MRPLTCEMCGGTDLLKDGGVFVCQTCGCKYTVEEARKIMMGDDAPAAAPAVPAAPAKNTAAIDNYLLLAKNAEEASNHEEAENYANKVIELDATNSAAWEIKGEAAGWQSKANNNRMGESVTAWLNAIQYAAPEDVSALRERIANAYTNLFLAMVQLRCNNFAGIQDQDNLDKLMGDVKSGVEMMNTLTGKGGVSFNRIPTYTNLARKMNSAACDGYKDAQSNFGPEHRNMAKWQWNRFTGNCDRCIKLLEFALHYCRDQSLGKTICNNMVTIGEDARDSQSWTFNVHSYRADNYDPDYSFTDEAKKIRTKNIEGYRSSRRFYESDPRDKVVDKLQGGRKEEEIARSKEQYWQEHAEEKAALEAERASLKAAMAEAEVSLTSLPISAQKDAAKKYLSDLQSQHDSLGLFKGKEKKALQVKIDDQKALVEQLTAQETAAMTPIRQKVQDSSARIKEIDEELTKSRGQISANTDHFLIPNAVVDKKFTITPRALADHLAKIIPYPYKFSEIKSSNSAIEDFGTQFELAFTKEDEEEKNRSNYNINLYVAAESEDSPITAIIMEGMAAAQAAEKVHTAWGIFGSHLFMSLLPGVGQSKAEDLVLDIRYDNGRTLWTLDGLRYELASAQQALFSFTFWKEMLIIRPKD